MGMMNAMLGSGPGYSVVITAQGCEGAVVSGGTSTARYQLLNTGVATQTDNGSNQNITGQWLLAGVAADFEARGTFSSVSGGTTAGPTTYTSLSASQAWTLQSTNSDHTCSLLIEIRHIASGLVVASATISMATFGSP